MNSRSRGPRFSSSGSGTRPRGDFPRTSGERGYNRGNVELAPSLPVIDGAQRADIGDAERSPATKFISQLGVELVEEEPSQSPDPTLHQCRDLWHWLRVPGATYPPWWMRGCRCHSTALAPSQCDRRSHISITARSSRFPHQRGSGWSVSSYRQMAIASPICVPSSSSSIRTSMCGNAPCTQSVHWKPSAHVFHREFQTFSIAGTCALSGGWVNST
jgi:hypothetical protein